MKKSSIVSSHFSPQVVTYLYLAKERSEVLFHWFGEIFLNLHKKKNCPIYTVLFTGDHSHLKYLFTQSKFRIASIYYYQALTTATES